MLTDHETEIFFVGFFAAVMSIWPVAFLLLLPHDGWRKGFYKGEYERKIKLLEKDNEDLRTDLVFHQQVLDKYLRTKFSEKNC